MRVRDQKSRRVSWDALPETFNHSIASRAPRTPRARLAIDEDEVVELSDTMDDSGEML